jgi:hypothetical protein
MDNTYRGFLQTLASSGGGIPAKEANALLQVVGDDGGINQGFANQNFDGTSYSGYTPDAGVNYDSSRGQIKSNDEWYGPGGIASLNAKYSANFRNQGAGNAQTQTVRNPGGVVLGRNTGSGGGDGGAEQLQRRQNQTQIDGINRLLGTYAPEQQSGNQDIDRNYNEQGRRLGEQRTSANVGYDDQRTEAEAGRTRGYEQVDNYANNSANSLNRIFQGANAGNSSVARQLAPSLVGKASDSRRLDVTQTANQNFSGVKKAREEANSGFDYANQELEDNRGYAKQDLEKGINQAETGQFNQRMALEQQLGQDTSGSQREIDTRTSRLQQLFGAGRFTPGYQARGVAPKAVNLNDYNVDPTQIQSGGNPQQAGGNFYANQLKKRDELRVR